MSSGPIEKRLRECTDEDGALAARAGKWLRALPEPTPLSESVRRRTLSRLGASRSGRGVHLTMLAWAVLSALLVSTAAASAKRHWFPNWFHRHAPVVVEKETDAVLVEPVVVPDVPPKRLKAVVEEPALPEEMSRPPAGRSRASSPSKSEKVRPRLLSDPQRDAIPRVLPKLVYDAEMYSALFDVCVSAQGRVTKVSVVRGQDASLDRQIVEAIQRWSYLPAQTDGQPVAMCFPLVYRIQVQRD